MKLEGGTKGVIQNEVKELGVAVSLKALVLRE